MIQETCKKNFKTKLILQNHVGEMCSLEVSTRNEVAEWYFLQKTRENDGNKTTNHDKHKSRAMGFQGTIICRVENIMEENIHHISVWIGSYQVNNN